MTRRPAVAMGRITLQDDGATCRVILTRGEVSLIDAQDAPLAAQSLWFLNSGGYAYNGRMLLHRLLLSPPADREVDHINGDRLDNRRANLRVVTRSENSQNVRAHKRSKSGVRGVWFGAGKWIAGINTGGRRIHLGRFLTLEEAEVAVRAGRARLMPYSQDAGATP